MEIRELATDAEREPAVRILRQLWTDASPEEVLSWTGDDRYTLFGRFDGDELVGVAGVRIDDFLHHVRHAWLYDLVVDEPRRGEGHGTALVEFVEEWADEQGCERVALASPRAKKGVHEFYADRDYEKWGYIIETDL